MKNEQMKRKLSVPLIISGAAVMVYVLAFGRFSTDHSEAMMYLFGLGGAMVVAGSSLRSGKQVPHD